VSPGRHGGRAGGAQPSQLNVALVHKLPAAIILWNTRYLETALDTLCAGGASSHPTIKLGAVPDGNDSAQEAAGPWETMTPTPTRFEYYLDTAGACTTLVDPLELTR
jgi:hypothetical protein